MPVPAASSGPVLVDATRLHEEVQRLRRRESRRVFDPHLYVGAPGGARTGFVVRAQDLPGLDASLRTDIVAALLDEAPPSWRVAWLARPGGPEPHDLDLAWLSAARTAFGMHGRRLDAFCAVTPLGWRDLLGDETGPWVDRDGRRLD